MLARPRLNLPPLQERIFLVTGGSGGVGRLVAEKLACTGATVLVHGKSLAKVQATVKQMRELPGAKRLVGFAADLSVMEEVRHLAETIREQFPCLHGICNHACILANDRPGAKKVTADGHDNTLAVNLLAPFLLTSLLLEPVARSNCGRILMHGAIQPHSTDITGPTHCVRPRPRDDDGRVPEGERMQDFPTRAHEWSSDKVYSFGKLGVAMLINELHCRYGDAPRLTFNSLDPGTVDAHMLKAGCSKGGCTRPVAARASFEMLAGDDWQHYSGHCFGGASQVVHNAEQSEWLWQQLLEMTGAVFPPRTRRPSYEAAEKA